jgi:hypothetical protein
LENKVYATTINFDFNNFEVNMTETQIKYGDKDLGLRMYKENDIYARCMTSNALVEIHLSTTDSITKINKSNLPAILYDFSADIDLISYNNKFRFSAKKTLFMGKNNIYSFQVNHDYDNNYYKHYSYKKDKVNKILGYYNSNVTKILFLYQTNNDITYFIIDYKNKIFSISEFYSFTIINSFEKLEYNLFSLVGSPEVTDLGHLDVNSIEYIN